MKITDANYFSTKANKEYMSASQYKSFCKCEAMAMAEIKGKWKRPETKALTLGKFVDAYFTDDFEKFCGENQSKIYKKNGEMYAEFEQAMKAIKAVEAQPQMMKYLRGGHQEIMTGEINGVPFKIKIDSLKKKEIVDLKYMADFEDKYSESLGYRVPWYEAWGYDIQGAIYQEIVRQNTGKKLPFILDAVSKESVPDLTLIKLNQNLLDYQLEEVYENAPRFQAIKQGIIKPTRCEHCDYCKSTRKVKLIETEFDTDLD